jgi:hypothetical protein
LNSPKGEFLHREAALALEPNQVDRKIMIEHINCELMAIFPDKRSLILETSKKILNSGFAYDTVTLPDLYIAVWLWIQKYVHSSQNSSEQNSSQNSKRNDIYTRFLQELYDMKSVCSTGMVVRLVNILQGYTTDPLLQIKISSTDRAYACLRLIFDTILKEAPENIQEKLISEKTVIRDTIKPYIQNHQNYLNNWQKWLIEYEISQDDLNSILDSYLGLNK